MSPRNIVAGVFEQPDQAEQAVAELRRLGFPEDAIGVVSRKDRLELDPVDERGMGSVEQGAATGAVAGLCLGALWTLVALVGGVPGIIVGGSALVTFFAGAGAGVSIGTVFGALLGLGFPEAEARWYEDEVQSGQVLVTVRTESRYNEAFAVLRRFGAYDMAMGRPARADAMTLTTPAVPEERDAAASHVGVGDEGGGRA